MKVRVVIRVIGRSETDILKAVLDGFFVVAVVHVSLERDKLNGNSFSAFPYKKTVLFILRSMLHIRETI